MAVKEVEVKDARFDTRLSREQKAFFEKAARVGGYRNLTDFVIMAVQEKAAEIIAAQERIVASEQDNLIFFEAVLNPPRPNEALSKAARDYHAHRSA